MSRWRRGLYGFPQHSLVVRLAMSAGGVAFGAVSGPDVRMRSGMAATDAEAAVGATAREPGWPGGFVAPTS